MPERVAGIVLAAGSSSRFGQNKLLLELDGESLVRRAVRATGQAGVDQVVVVLGHQAERVEAELAGLNCVTVVNHDYAQGVGTSLRLGVARVDPTIDAAVVVLADMPFVTRAMIGDVVAAYRTTRAPLVVSRYGHIDAPPTLYARSLMNEVGAIEDDQGGKQVVVRHRDHAEVLAWPEQALADIDVREDYDHARYPAPAASQSLRRELLELAANLARQGEPFVMATVVGRKPPMSAQVGDLALVTGSGDFYGWVGGSCTRPTVEEEGRRALADGRPRRVVLDSDPDLKVGDGVLVFPMTCHSGGAVEIHIQPVLPSPTLLIYGASPIARALGRLAKAMGFLVSAVDPTADASGFPEADLVATDPTDVSGRSAAPLFAVVATQGQWDEDALLAALAHSPDYIGVVASRKRFAEMRSLLANRASEADFARIKNPAGLDLGANLPEEIALGILAEIVKEHRAVVPLAATHEAPKSSVIDPVCGMTVHVEANTPRAEYQGEDFFFCNPGCRERFLANPDRYLAART